jgi:hypothetical protein
MTQSHATNYPTRNERVGAKPLTDYTPAIALKRTRFYLDVMEAHFAELGVLFETAKANGIRTIPNPRRTCEALGEDRDERSVVLERT